LNGVVAIQGEAVALEGKVSYLAISTDLAARAFLIRLQGCACTGAAIFRRFFRALPRYLKDSTVIVLIQNIEHVVTAHTDIAHSIRAISSVGIYFQIRAWTRALHIGAYPIRRIGCHVAITII
jgi:sulfur transfer complex TusBCD TusB component (DsrH family)